jgi:hypothetical protein
MLDLTTALSLSLATQVFMLPLLRGGRSSRRRPAKSSVCRPLRQSPFLSQPPLA